MYSEYKTGLTKLLTKKTAEYLDSIKRIDENAFEGITETLQYVLPYAKDLVPKITPRVRFSLS